MAGMEGFRYGATKIGAQIYSTPGLFGLGVPLPRGQGVAGLFGYEPYLAAGSVSSSRVDASHDPGTYLHTVMSVVDRVCS